MSAPCTSAPWLAISAAVLPSSASSTALGQLGRAEGRVGRHPHRAAEGEHRVVDARAARRARTTARWPSARACAPPRRCRSARRRRGAGRARRSARARRARACPRGPRRSPAPAAARRAPRPSGVTATRSSAAGAQVARRCPARAPRPRAAWRLLGHLLALGGQRQFGSGGGHGHSLRGGTLRRCRAASAQPGRSTCAGAALALAAPGASGRRGPARGRRGQGRHHTPHRLHHARLGPGRRACSGAAHAALREGDGAAARAAAARARVEDLNMVAGGMVQQAARAGGLRRARGDRPGHPHARRAHRLLELPLQGPRVRHAAGSQSRGAPCPTRVSTRSWSGG